MDKRDRIAILGQWEVRDPTPVELEDARKLARELEGSPLSGKPLPDRTRLRAPADTYILSLGGPLPYMRRRRRIDEEIAAHERRLDAAWRDLARECAGPSGFARRWRDLARRWTFHAVNELIAAHNRWYPAEARLPMDPRTGDYILVGGRRYDLHFLDETWILERFPAELRRAAA
jgi:hypothetical protein